MIVSTAGNEDIIKIVTSRNPECGQGGLPRSRFRVLPIQFHWWIFNRMGT